MTSEEENVSTCGCCEGIASETPATVENQAGLSALAYRVGTHSAFRQSMQAALSGQSALRDLTTRSDDDPSLALTDAWAMVLDVLSFYQERIANEGFLRTAEERRSVLEMARSISYQLRPGVAASTYLAFTLDDSTGSPTEVTIELGTKAQSIPGQNEKAQVFETIEEIEARSAWNELKPKTRELIVPSFSTTQLYLEGITTNLKPGDALLIVGNERKNNPGSENWDFRRVESVVTDSDADYTVVTLDRGLGTSSPHTEPAGENLEVYALRQRCSLFGYNAQQWDTLPSSLTVDGAFKDRQYSWADAPFAASTTQINLDAVYSQVTSDSWIVLTRLFSSKYVELYYISEAAEEPKTDYLLSAQTTRLTLSGEHIDEFAPKYVTAFAQSELLELAEQPITTPVSGNSVTLDQEVEGLESGRLILISGTDAENGTEVREVVTLDDATSADGSTTLTFTSDLQHTYDVDSVTLNANVARATHGESKSEILGSGDGSKIFQEFQLKQTPLTYISASTPSGGESTLEVRVNDILWNEVATLYGRGATEHVYTTLLDDDGVVTVRFGDGITGARLPTGTDNITATYRVGSGLDGMLEADQISLLLTQQLGVKNVSNPIAPSGADDPEELEDARENAPLTVLTLDRIVSVQDFEDFASAFGGVGKAQATLLWNGEQRLVHITVAGVEGASVEEGSDLYQNLKDGIDAARHADQPVMLAGYESIAFSLEAKVLVDTAYDVEDVLASVQDALQTGFSFDQRAFGQAVSASEVLALMQNVEGVMAVDLDLLNGEDPFEEPFVPAYCARWNEDDSEIKPAQLLTINPEGIKLSEMTI